MSQKEHSSANRNAWSHKAYEAWHRLGGSPAEVARKLRVDPKYPLRHYLAYLGDVRGKTVANLLGSHGRRAVALSLLGAEVTVVDICEDNQRYASEVAQCAGVSFRYVVSDLLEWQTDEFLGHFDFVLMELGILHYFVDLNALSGLIHSILKAGGKFILHEFHPITKKCGPRHHDGQLILEGNYFSDAIIDGPVAYHSAFSKEEADTFPRCRLRYWQLGEIVTAVISSGLVLEKLVETPHGDFSRLPGTFTLVAHKQG